MIFDICGTVFYSRRWNKCSQDLTFPKHASPFHFGTSPGCVFSGGSYPKPTANDSSPTLQPQLPGKRLCVSLENKLWDERANRLSIVLRCGPGRYYLRALVPITHMLMRLNSISQKTTLVAPLEQKGLQMHFLKNPLKGVYVLLSKTTQKSTTATADRFRTDPPLKNLTRCV